MAKSGREIIKLKSTESPEFIGRKKQENQDRAFGAQKIRQTSEKNTSYSKKPSNPKVTLCSKFRFSGSI